MFFIYYFQHPHLAQFSTILSGPGLLPEKRQLPTCFVAQNYRVYKLKQWTLCSFGNISQDVLNVTEQDNGHLIEAYDDDRTLKYETVSRQSDISQDNACCAL